MDESSLAIPATPKPAGAPRLGGALAAIVIYIGIQLVVGIATAIVLLLLAHLRTPELGPRALLHDRQTLFLIIGVTLPVSCAMSIWAFHGMYRRCWTRAGKDGIGVTAIPISRFLLHVPLGLAVAILGAIVSHLLLHGHALHQDIAKIMLQAPLGTRLLIAVSAVTLVPLAEEILFRGIVLSALMRHLPVAMAVIVDACVFALVHLPGMGWKPQGLPALGLVAVLCCWRRLKTGSVYSGVAIHAGNNLLAMIGLLMIAR